MSVVLLRVEIAKDFLEFCHLLGAEHSDPTVSEPAVRPPGLQPPARIGLRKARPRGPLKCQIEFEPTGPARNWLPARLHPLDWPHGVRGALAEFDRPEFFEPRQF